MIYSRTDWAVFGVALATGAVNAMLAGARRGATGLRRLDARRPAGETVPAVVVAPAS